MKKLIALLLALVMVFSLVACGAKEEAPAEKPAETPAETPAEAPAETPKDLSIVVSHQPYSHGLSSYIGEQEGTYANAGLDMEILWFTGGNTQNEALGADEWDAGCYGSPPSIAAGVAYNAHIIGVNVEDSVSIDYFVRPDSDIAQISGEVEGYPDILGNADTWRGKTILCATSTSVHFGLISTLAKMGLTQNDVNIVHMDVPSAYAAFKAGEGDVVSLWDPQSYQAEEEGWVRASCGEATGEPFPTVYVASEKAIEENWDAVYTWFKTNIEINEAFEGDIDGQTEYLLQRQLENGIDTDESLAKRFCEDRPLSTLEKNIEYFKGEPGSRYMDEVMFNIVDFFVAQGSYSEADKETLKTNGWIDSQFIEALAAERGIEMK